MLLAVLAIAGCGGDGSDGGAVLESPAANDVALMPSRSDYRVGETVTVEVVVDNAENVGSVPFHLLYDQGVLKFEPPGVEGPWLGSDGVETIFLAVEASSGGELVIGASRLAERGIDGSGRLATFRFLAIGEGSSLFRFTSASVMDPSARNLPAQFRTNQVRIGP
jgi:hypothetical protein